MTVDLVLGAIEYEAPLANPSPNGLYGVVQWVQDGGEDARWLGEGVRIRPHNYGGEDAVGVWDAPWCGPAEPGSGSDASQIKFGIRPSNPQPFVSATFWAYDQCDPTAASQAEVRLRVAQNLRLAEQVGAEAMLAQRMLTDATPVGVADLRDAVSYLEGQLALTGTLGVIHANPEHAAQEFGLVVGNGPGYRTPLGHRWCFGGGYVPTIGHVLIATSPLFGWRNDMTIRDTFDHQHDTYAAIAERSVVVGYEHLVAAASF